MLCDSGIDFSPTLLTYQHTDVSRLIRLSTSNHYHIACNIGEFVVVGIDVIATENTMADFWVFRLNVDGRMRVSRHLQRLLAGNVIGVGEDHCAAAS
jgi:hypothetical protein